MAKFKMQKYILAYRTKNRNGQIEEKFFGYHASAVLMQDYEKLINQGFTVQVYKQFKLRLNTETSPFKLEIL